MEFQLSYPILPKIMMLKCCTQYISKFGKLSSGYRTGKGQFSFQSQRRAMPKCSNYQTTVLISYASKVILKILQARPQQHVNQEFPDVQAGFRKGRGTRDQIANICWIIEKGKAREFQKNVYFCFIDYDQTSDCVDHNKLWKILKETGILDHLTQLLRNLYAGQEATVQFSRSVVSDSLQPHGLQHTKPPCPSPTPRACSISCSLRRWCNSTISSSVIPFSSCLQAFPASGSFPMSQFFARGGQSIGVSASASVFPTNIQDWFPLG